MRLALALLLLAASPALGQDDPAYRDDRSTAEAVVASYYNAVNRREFARAYSYFGPNAPEDYGAWKAGYEETGSVEVRFGEVVADGAAGSIYYSVPVVLAVTSRNGAASHFSGCYTIRLSQPAVQEPPFVAMHIEDARLTPAAAEATPPARC